MINAFLLLWYRERNFEALLELCYFSLQSRRLNADHLSNSTLFNCYPLTRRTRFQGVHHNVIPAALAKGLAT